MNCDLFKISFLRRTIKRQAGRGRRRSSFVVRRNLQEKKERTLRMLLRTTTTTTTTIPTLQFFRFPTIPISKPFTTTTTNYTPPHSSSSSSKKPILNPEDLSISAGENPQILTEQATALLAPLGKWKICKNKKGIERNFRFQTFKTTWVNKTTPPKSKNNNSRIRIYFRHSCRKSLRNVINPRIAIIRNGAISIILHV